MWRSVTGARRVPAGGEDVIRHAFMRGPRPSGVSCGAQKGADSVAILFAADYWRLADLYLVIPGDAPHNAGLEAEVRAIVEARETSFPPRPSRPDRLHVETVERRAGEKDGALYLRRNGVVLDRGRSELFAFPETGEERQRSGTWATVREAQRRNILVYIFPLDGSPQQVRMPAVLPKTRDPWDAQPDDPTYPPVTLPREPPVEPGPGEPGYRPDPSEYLDSKGRW